MGFGRGGDSVGHREAARLLPCSVPETRNPTAMNSRSRNVAGPEKAMAHLLLLIPVGAAGGL